MLQQILVGLDGSALAETILPYVASLARALQGEVTLLTVTHLPEETDIGDHHATADQVIGKANTLAQDYLNLVQKRLQNSGVPVHTQVTVGDAPSEIVRTAQQSNKDLIALATHGRSGLQRWLYGSVADDVLHTSRTPLLLIRPAEGDNRLPGITQIIVPLDGSPLAASVLPYSETLATALHVPVTLVRAVEPMYVATDPTGAVAAYPEILQGLQETVRAYLDQVATGLRSKGLRVEATAPVGNPASEIVDMAHQNQGALVVMATHGRTGLAGAVLGSVARRVVQHSGAPILLIHPGKGEQ